MCGGGGGVVGSVVNVVAPLHFLLPLLFPLLSLLLLPLPVLPLLLTHLVIEFPVPLIVTLHHLLVDQPLHPAYTHI